MTQSLASIWLNAVVFFLGTSCRVVSAVSTRQQNVGSLLQEMDDLLAGWDRLERQVNQALDAVDEITVDEIQQQREACTAHQKAIQSTWTAWNQDQWESLQDRLQSILQAELDRRENAQQQVDEYKRKKEHIKRQKEQVAAGKPIEKMPPPVPESVSTEQLEKILSSKTFLQQRDERLGAWIAQLLRETMQSRPSPTWEWAENIVIPTADDNQDDSEDRTKETSRDNDSTESGCWTLLDSVVHIQQALFNYSHDDGLGVTDHARGGRIDHHATSPTYHPGLVPTTERTTWGTSRLRDYLIPEDLEEYILAHVDGWQEWLVWPWHYLDLSHSLSRWMGITSSSTSATTAPPETILQGATWPGACWPMQGNKGQVTLVLPYPVHPTAISIDHVSKLLVRNRDAAPKTIRVWAYAPCDKKDCNGLEYDQNEVYDLFRGHSVEYSLDGNSVQTFWLPPPKPVKSHNDDDESDPNSCTAPEDDDDEEAMIASCSGDFSMLSPDSLVRAIKLEILENWGSGDYTCLYRVRVHGTPSA